MDINSKVATSDKPRGNLMASTLVSGVAIFGFAAVVALLPWAFDPVVKSFRQASYLTLPASFLAPFITAGAGIASAGAVLGLQILTPAYKKQTHQADWREMVSRESSQKAVAQRV